MGGEGGLAVTVAWDCAVIRIHRRRLGRGVSGLVVGNTVAREVRNVACMVMSAAAVKRFKVGN